MHNRTKRFLSACALTLIASSFLLAQQSEYPKARKSDHVDTYHGVAVPDPYRWLEDDNSPETAAWVESQNKVTFGYLERIPFRKSLTERVIALNNYEKVTAPFRKGPYVFFSKNDGLQNQSVLFYQEGMRGSPRGADRCEYVVEGRHHAHGCVRAVEGREVRRLRHLEERFRLAGIQGDGAGLEEDAGRLDRVGQGLGRRLAG